MKHTPELLKAILESYEEALKDPDGTEVCLDIQTLLDKSPLDWRLAGEYTLMGHYEELCRQLKERRHEFDSFEAYSDEWEWAIHNIHHTAKRITKLHDQIARCERRKVNNF